MGVNFLIKYKISMAENQEQVLQGNLNVDEEYELDDPVEAMLGQRKAMTSITQINPKSRTFRSYMDDLVNPVLFDALQSLVKERPDNPIEFLAYTLVQNNPKLAQPTVLTDEVISDKKSTTQVAVSISG